MIGKLVAKIAMSIAQSLEVVQINAQLHAISAQVPATKVQPLANNAQLPATKAHPRETPVQPPVTFLSSALSRAPLPAAL
jgi:hypothetical protein